MRKRSRYTIKTKEMIISPVDETNVWEGDWIIILRGEKDTEIGKASFAGEKLLGTVPLSVELYDGYRNKGYGTQVLKLLTDFAFGYKNIYEVKVDTRSDNDSSVYALEKAGFVRRHKEGKDEVYTIIKPRTVWLSLYLYIGFIAGIMIGIVIGMMWTGLGIGLVIGLVMGALMDAKEKKDRANVTGDTEK